MRLIQLMREEESTVGAQVDFAGFIHRTALSLSLLLKEYFFPEVSAPSSG
jgi:hypothetical protein